MQQRLQYHGKMTVPPNILQITESSMNIYAIVILTALLLDYFLNFVADRLNLQFHHIARFQVAIHFKSASASDGS